ncbi:MULTISPECIES: hypothetical protein [unclassified Streptomyces]|uniref:hypothetical protein n=1 Tax=unclassified Streptomyces TaxID=2593676 RepID=UPI00342EE1FB|nr:hypothetical protein OG214_21050 [Streptomyces sp. NBC_00872]
MCRAVAVSGLVLAGILGSAGAATAAEHEGDSPLVSIGSIDDSIEDLLEQTVLLDD